MENYALSVDSSACLSKDELFEHGIRMAYLSYTLDGKEYVDKFEHDRQKQQFYDLLKQGHSAQSSRVNPESFMSAWIPALENGQDILHLSLSQKVSGSFESACQAAEELSAQYGRKIRVLDTKTGSFALTAIALDLTDRKIESVDEAFEFVKKRLDAYNLIFTVGDIRHLYRGGRISHIKALFGGLLNLKPLLYVSSEGKLSFVMNARGIRQAISLMAKKMLNNATALTQRAYIAHGGNASLADMLKDKVQQLFPNLKEIRIDYLTPVLGLHAGPGSLVLCFQGGSRDNVVDDSSIKGIIGKVLPKHEQ